MVLRPAEGCLTGAVAATKAGYPGRRRVSGGGSVAGQTRLVQGDPPHHAYEDADNQGGGTRRHNGPGPGVGGGEGRNSARLAC